MTSRCSHCGDPAPAGWKACLQCHAWDDLFASLEYREVGLDQRRLHRALGHLRGRRPVEPLESLLRKLIRRVTELEQAVPNVNGRLHRVECEMDLQ